MNKIKEIIDKIKNTFSKLFKKKEKLLICDVKEEIIEDTKEFEIEEKEEFLEIYENVKNGLIPLESLLISDLIKVQTMLIEEGQIYDEKINERKSELANLRIKKEKLIDEKLELGNI